MLSPISLMTFIPLFKKSSSGVPRSSCLSISLLIIKIPVKILSKCPLKNCKLYLTNNFITVLAGYKSQVTEELGLSREVSYKDLPNLMHIINHFLSDLLHQIIQRPNFYKLHFRFAVIKC